jgi:hypothetical protein
MSDLSTIRVLNFWGRKEEWPTWSEKFLALISMLCQLLTVGLGKKEKLNLLQVWQAAILYQLVYNKEFAT